MSKQDNIFFEQKACQSICQKKNINVDDATLAIKIVSKYFSIYGRSKKYEIIFNNFSQRFSDLINQLDNFKAIDFGELMFLLGYTIHEDKALNQDKLLNEIALPYQRRIGSNWQSENIAFDFDGRANEEMLFVCRHGTTRGTYAPGKSVFSYVEALSQAKQKITIAIMGNIDDVFNSLAKKHTNVHIFRLGNIARENQARLTADLINYLKPHSVFTEIEFGLPSVIAITSNKFKTFFMSQGYFNLPWYNHIALPENQIVPEDFFRKDAILRYPSIVSSKLLDIDVPKTKILDLKAKFKITEGDLVVGSFARMEKFSPSFLEDVIFALESCPNTKLILAGPNDATDQRKALSTFIAQGRAFLLGPSDTNLLGKLCNVGIDTHPSPCGHAALELHAKGVPVMYRKTDAVESFQSQRLDELSYIRKDDLVALIQRFNDDLVWANGLSSKSKILVKKDEEGNFQAFSDRVTKLF